MGRLTLQLDFRGGGGGGGRGEGNRKREAEREGVRRQRGGIAFCLRFGRDSV